MRMFLPKVKRIKSWAAARRVQGWLTGWLQDRRRSRQETESPLTAPVIHSGSFEWGVSEPEYADVWFEWTFAHGSAPSASIEVWRRVNGEPYEPIATVPSSHASFYHSTAIREEAQLTYKVRYRNGDMFGPFSNEYIIDVYL
jgi:hypothetical protein